MIYVYGQKDCAPCTLLTKKLNREGVPHTYIDLSQEENKHHLNRLRETGVQMQTPIVETPTTRFSGMQPAKIEQAIAESRAHAASMATPAVAGPVRSVD